MLRPIIAITPSITEDEQTIRINKNYCDAIERSGALALIINYNTNNKEENINDILRICDGVMFIGGVDIDPNLFGQNPEMALGEISPVRDEFETALLRAAMHQKKPVLAICRGIQLLASALGGTIFQDIYSIKPTPIKHAQSAPGYYGTHSVDVSENTLLYDIVKSGRIFVNSYHHQSVDCLPKDFMVSAVSPDGITEAIELVPHDRDSGQFVLGVQWHPERMFERSEEQFAIFKAFVRACHKSV